MYIVTKDCVGCEQCEDVCPTEAIKVKGVRAEINQDTCAGCGECFETCPLYAIEKIKEK